MTDPLVLWIILTPHSRAATFFVLIRSRIASKLRLPPPSGPPHNCLFFGNTLPSAFACCNFEEWTQKYGPVFSLCQGFTTVTVIGHQAAIDIMEKEGAALVEACIPAGETPSSGMRVLLTPAGDRLKKVCKVLHAHLQPRIVADATPALTKSARQHVINIPDDPANTRGT
ncbi:hypothetical protein BD779DRAFT_1676602 [Infundibulicybe gibba]|nr:hypothetical protein BD779DRAFT_1676602 [Infundibulicybe gibba]